MTDFPRRILPRWQNASAVMTGISEATLAARGLARIAAPVLWRPVRPIPEQAHVALVRALVVDHVGAPTAAASAAAILRQRQKRFALPFPTGIISALTSRSAPPVGLRLALALARARRTSGDRIAATTEPGRALRHHITTEEAGRVVEGRKKLSTSDDSSPFGPETFRQLAKGLHNDFPRPHG
jgi:hypothetical protein